MAATWQAKHQPVNPAAIEQLQRLGLEADTTTMGTTGRPAPNVSNGVGVVGRATICTLPSQTSPKAPATRMKTPVGHTFAPCAPGNRHGFPREGHQNTKTARLRTIRDLTGCDSD